MINFAWRLAALVVAGLLAVFLIGLLIGVGLELGADLFVDPPAAPAGIGDGDR